jgi:hypothetical protein
MSYMIEQLVAQLEQRQAEAQALFPGENFDVFHGKYPHGKFNYGPRFLYFYYIRVNDDGSLHVAHYEHFDPDPAFPTDRIRKWKELPRTKSGLEEITKKLALNARLPAADQNPKPSGASFVDIVWKRRSFIVFFFDEKNWKLYKKSAAGQGSSVVFLTKKNSLDFAENHSFFDAQDLDIDFGGGDKRSAIAIMNHIKKNADGDQLEGGDGPDNNGREAYQFNFLLRIAFDDGTVSPLDIVIDPGGTNQGPPELP